MRKFLVAVFFVLFAPLFVQAAQNIQINWDGQDHSREIVGNTRIIRWLSSGPAL